MLVSCPECEQNVSDRAPACPKCGFPIGELMAEQARVASEERERASRTLVGDVDCAACLATGYQLIEEKDPDGKTRTLFSWCHVCEHTGRVSLCRSDRGFFAVARVEVDAFTKGERDVDDDLVVFLGKDPPGPHRYPQAGQRHP